MWDVTHAKRGKVSIVSFLLTHPVWDVTHLWNHPGEISYLFLLTHPVWDVTLGSSSKDGGANAFLLTHPVWDVTTSQRSRRKKLTISTHTSRVGCDTIAPPL